MSLRSEFLNSPAWQILESKIKARVEQVTEEGFLAPDYPTLRYNAGYRDALRDMLALPHQLLKDVDELEVTKERFIQNHPKRATTGTW